jgi:hypothetical protein
MVIADTMAAVSILAAPRMTGLTRMYPRSTEEPAIAGTGGRITATSAISSSPSLGTWEARQTMVRRAE